MTTYLNCAEYRAANCVKERHRQEASITISKGIILQRCRRAGAGLAADSGFSQRWKYTQHCSHVFT